MINYAILPSKDCRRLRHHTVDRLKQPGPGKIEVCAVCSVAYEMALATFDGDEAQADAFVQALRREKTAGPLR
jgi:hypothetical protein